MRVILLEDIPGVGRKNEVKDLKPGHARSFLVNKKRAIVATPDALRAIEKRRLQETQDSEIKSALILKTLSQLNEKKVTMREKVNDAGHLYHGIALPKIIEAIQKELNITILPEHVIYEKPIKEKGEFPLSLRFSNKIVGSFTLSVVPL